MKRILLLSISILILQSSYAQVKPAAPKPKTATLVKPPRMAQVTTNFGVMVIKLYDSTPQHRDNFIKLVKSGFYDSLLFHRIIDGFMIQGGDPVSKNAADSIMLGSGEAPGDRIPAEFQSTLLHKKGALAAARDNNPEKASSNCQFYIVQGQPAVNAQLNQIECTIRNDNPEFYYTDAQRKIYNTQGGTPFLDQNYTVFGEVIKGMEVIDKIAKAPKDQNDRPLQNISMKIKMLN